MCDGVDQACDGLGNEEDADAAEAKARELEEALGEEKAKHLIAVSTRSGVDDVWRMIFSFLIDGRHRPYFSVRDNHCGGITISCSPVS